MPTIFPLHSLVLYKNRPARLVEITDRLTIELEDGNIIKVRPKDLFLLHPGPVTSLQALAPPVGDLLTAWELLVGNPAPAYSLAELAELIFGIYTPASAWAAWNIVMDGLYFRSFHNTILVCSPDEVARQQAVRQTRLAEAQAWNAFLKRLRQGQWQEQDRPFLREVEEMALGRRETSRVLVELGKADRPAAAHALLLELGMWDMSRNPYPARLGLNTQAPILTWPEIPPEERLDLTDLQAYAIDDPGNQEPDDALSFDGECLWVHVADVAALVEPGSPLDLEARGRGGTLYLPEGTVPMLPSQAVASLGLGLGSYTRWPALSFAIRFDPQATIAELKVVPSWVRVERLTYEEVETRLDQVPFSSLDLLAQRYQARRQAAGAMLIELPEVKLSVIDGRVLVYPILPLRSRALVREAMLAAGEAAARYAVMHELPFPFAVQEPPEPNQLEEIQVLGGDLSLAGMHRLRRVQKRSLVQGEPGLHAGVGLSPYARVTSPLRRYLDLVAHQQLRSHLTGKTILGTQEMLERIGAADAASVLLSQAESLSERHWKLVYLQQHPGVSSVAFLVEKRGLQGKLIIPELALDVQLHLPRDLPHNSEVALQLKSVDLAELEAYFRIN